MNVDSPSNQHPRVAEWLQIREPLERQLEPLGNAAISAMGLLPGERVLDLGCGIGGTPQAIARVVGPRGYVLGVDVIQSAIDVQRSFASNPPNLEFAYGDAETYPFAARSFDAIYSRFGTMFFSEPVSAFANIRQAICSGGRMAFVCWRDLSSNELDYFPLRAAAPLLPKELVDESGAATWFSFSSRDNILATLAGAGFIDVDIQSHDMMVSTGDLQSSVNVCSRVGALGAILRRHPHLRNAATPVLTEALRARDGPSGPALCAAVWVVTARVS